MPIKNEVTMKSIQQLSLMLSTQQLELFVGIIEGLAEWLQVVNKDTDKAYRMYLNSIASIHEEAHINEDIMPFHHGITNVTPLKH